MEKKVQRNFLWIALLVLGTIWILARHNQVTPYQTDKMCIRDRTTVYCLNNPSNYPLSLKRTSYEDDNGLFQLHEPKC